MQGCTDGTFYSTGQKFFDCPSGRGLFYPLKNLRLDARYAPEMAMDGNREKYDPVIPVFIVVTVQVLTLATSISLKTLSQSMPYLSKRSNQQQQVAKALWILLWLEKTLFHPLLLCHKQGREATKLPKKAVS